MEFDFDIGRALGASSSSANSEPGSATVFRVEDSALQHPKWGQCLREVLDKIGERSRRAQGLSKVVTSGSGGLSGHRVYLLASGKCVFGVLKVGQKRLFVARNADEGLKDISPLCALDFYVHEAHQRGGMGKKLFVGMLSREGVTPERLAYDKPSPKLLGFLRKHYSLARFNPQSNHFVVFDAYFAPARSAAAPVAAAQMGIASCMRGGARRRDSESSGAPSASVRTRSAPVVKVQAAHFAPGSTTDHERQNEAAPGGDAADVWKPPRTPPQRSLPELRQQLAMLEANSPGATLSAAAPVPPSFDRSDIDALAAALVPVAAAQAQPPATNGAAHAGRPPRYAPARASAGSKEGYGGGGVRAGPTGGAPRRRARSESPLCQAARSALSPPIPGKGPTTQAPAKQPAVSPLVAAMRRGGF